jgi:hypothetical protein
MKALILAFSQREKYLFSALKAPCYVNLGHRPRIAAPSQTSAESATQRTVRCDGALPAWRQMMDQNGAGMNRAFSADALVRTGSWGVALGWYERCAFGANTYTGEGIASRCQGEG